MTKPKSPKPSKSKPPSDPPYELLCIDPGAFSGFAYAIDGDLNACGAMPFEEIIDFLTGKYWVSMLLVELPRAYPGAKSKAPVNDLITLAYRAGRIAGAIETRWIEEVAPAAWKASLPKSVIHERVRSVLTEHELEVAAQMKGTPKQLENAWDAIGMCLWRLGRVGRGCTRKKS